MEKTREKVKVKSKERKRKNVCTSTRVAVIKCSIGRLKNKSVLCFLFSVLTKIRCSPLILASLFRTHLPKPFKFGLSVQMLLIRSFRWFCRNSFYKRYFVICFKLFLIRTFLLRSTIEGERSNEKVHFN